MQVATLNYRYNPKDKYYSGSKSKIQHRHIVTSITDPQKKLKQRPYQADVGITSTGPLPPIKQSGKRPNSIRIKGSGVQSSKLIDASLTSFRQPSRSRSRKSNKNDPLGTRSRSITPPGTGKAVRLKFGYPVQIRAADFYIADMSESELRFREQSFINDSIRMAHQRIQSSKVPHYEALHDPNLKDFFQSPVVLEVVRKTLNIDLDARSASPKKRRNNVTKAYHGIVAKHSSGYGKLNGYDCLPPFSPARQQRSLTHDRHQSSGNTSITSVPTNNSILSQQKHRSPANNKTKQLTPNDPLSPVRHPTAVTGDTAGISNISQD